MFLDYGKQRGKKRMKCLSIISILVALCMIFTFVTPVMASDGTVTLEGKAWDVMTGLPIVGALVTLDTIDGQFTTTDSDGAYSFTIDEGTYDMTITKAGYQSVNASVGVVAGYTYTQDFALLAITVMLEGSVWDADTTAPIVGALVTVDGQVTTTDGDGAYSFAIEEGTYEMTATQAGYQSVNVSVGVVAGYTYTQDFYLVRSLCISGYKYSNDTGAGIAGWTIILKYLGGDEIAKTTTDANGKYQFCNLFPDNYEVCEEIIEGWTSVGPACIAVTLDTENVIDLNFYNTGESQPPEPGLEVGGDVYPVNKIIWLAPAIILAVIILSGTILLLKQRHILN